MTNNLNNESSTTAAGLQPLIVITQYGHFGNTTKPLIGLDCVIGELKRMRDRYKGQGKLMEAKAISKAVDNLRGMV